MVLQEDAILHSEDVSTKLLGNRGKGFGDGGQARSRSPKMRDLRVAGGAELLPSQTFVLGLVFHRAYGKWP